MHLGSVCEKSRATEVKVNHCTALSPASIVGIHSIGDNDTTFSHSLEIIKGCTPADIPTHSAHTICRRWL